MYSTKRIKKIMDKLKTLEAENDILASANIELEKKLADTMTDITLIKSDLTELKDISIIEPIIKK